MDQIAHSIRRVIEYGFVPFDVLPEFWALTLLSVLTGVVMLWVVGRTTPQRRLEVARARMASAIYEMRLFLDSPRRIVSAQGRLLAWSAAYVGYLIPAFLILSIPLGLLYLHGDVRYGLAPLPADEPLLIRVDLDRGIDGYAVALADTPELSATAPPLYIEREGRVYLRANIARKKNTTAVVRVGKIAVTKEISADPGTSRVRPERVRGVSAWWSFGDEEPISPASGVRAITLVHPDRPQSWLGLAIPWWLYWLLVATAAALLMRRPMGVVI